MRVEYCLYMKVRNGNGYEKEKFLKIGLLCERNKESFEKTCSDNESVMIAFRLELIPTNNHTKILAFELVPLSELSSEERLNVAPIKNDGLKKWVEKARNHFDDVYESIKESKTGSENSAFKNRQKKQASVDETSDNSTKELFERVYDKLDTIAENTSAMVDKASAIVDNTSAINHKIPGKIDSLAKIPLLGSSDGIWLTASEYAKRIHVTTASLRTERSKVRTGKMEGLVAVDGTCGIHGKHVWRYKGERSENGTEIYWYFLFGTDWDYSRLRPEN